MLQSSFTKLQHGFARKHGACVAMALLMPEQHPAQSYTALSRLCMRQRQQRLCPAAACAWTSSSAPPAPAQKVENEVLCA